MTTLKKTVAQLRAFGIPVTIDYVPQWGNRSMGHCIRQAMKTAYPSPMYQPMLCCCCTMPQEVEKKESSLMKTESRYGGSFEVLVRPIMVWSVRNVMYRYASLRL